MASKPDMEFSDPVSEAVRRRKRRQADGSDSAAGILGRPGAQFNTVTRNLKIITINITIKAKEILILEFVHITVEFVYNNITVLKVFPVFRDAFRDNFLMAFVTALNCATVVGGFRDDIDEDVDGVSSQEEEKPHSTEFYFNRTSEVLRTMHKENILSAEMERSVTEIIGGVKRQLAEFVQNKLNLTETPHHAKLGEHIDDLEGMPENAEAMRDIVDQGRYSLLS